MRLVSVLHKLSLATKQVIPVQDATIDNLLSLSEIAEDFTTPENTDFQTIASILSASFFLVGGVAGAGAAVGTHLGYIMLFRAMAS